MTANFDELKEAHDTLMKGYVNVLDQASNIPTYIISFEKKGIYTTKWDDSFLQIFFIKRVKPDTLWSIAFRFLVIQFVESHIKGKLNELRVAYVRLAQKLSVNEYKTWLKRTEKDLKEFGDTLSPLGIGSVLVKIGSILAVVAPLIPIANILSFIFGRSYIIQIPLLSQLWITYLLLIIILYFLIFISLSFVYKRILFFPDTDLVFVKLL